MDQDDVTFDDYDDNFLSNACKVELSQYSKERVPRTDWKKCPAMWWEEKRALYTVLFPLSLKFLAIPATSAPSERIWSISALYLTKCRSQLKPEIVACMIFLKENGAILKKYYEELTGEKGALLPGTYDAFDDKPNSEWTEKSLREMAGDEVDMLDV